MTLDAAIAAGVLLTILGGKAQPQERYRCQNQAQGRDELAVRDGAAQLCTALDAHAVQQTYGTAGSSQPVLDAGFDLHAGSTS